jgi:PadR family transcriptional regulator, regulatory protein PadR
MTKPLLELKGFLSFLILHELDKKSLCGEDLAKKIGRRKGGEQLTPGTIYPALKELREQGLVSFVQFGRKKMYSLTPEGKKELKHLYKLFSSYFQGLKHFIKPVRRPLKKTKISKQRRKIKK